jgi:hypothetical protein
MRGVEAPRISRNKNNMQISNIILSIVGLAAGGAIGYGFGLIQDAAARRNQRLEDGGKLNNGWAVMPGSMRRVSYLIIALVLVQFICPLVFTNGTQWWVSGGVVGGYGFVLYSQLREKFVANKVCAKKN